VTDFLSAKTDLLWAALVSAVVSAAVSYYFRRREARHKLAVQYEYEQRKKLRDLIGCFHGRLLQASNSLNYRFWNLYANSEAGWLDVGGDYRHVGYHFLSSVHRFLAVCSRQFENEAIYVDARIAEKKDFTFLSYLAALHWVMTDVAVFDGVPYDTSHQVDHFFADNFRHYCDACFPDGAFLSYEALGERIATDRSLDPVLRFFDGLRRSEQRLRWDRLVAFHLLLLAFINSFGYEPQYTSQQKFEHVTTQIRHIRILENLVGWLPRHGLGEDNEAGRILKAYRSLGARRVSREGAANCA
jgi:hypothetical protein